MAKQPIDVAGFDIQVIPFGTVTKTESLRNIPKPHLPEESKEAVQCLEEELEKQLSDSWSGAQRRPLESSSFTLLKMLRNKKKKENEKEKTAEELVLLYRDLLYR